MTPRGTHSCRSTTSTLSPSPGSPGAAHSRCSGRAAGGPAPATCRTGYVLDARLYCQVASGMKTARMPATQMSV